MVDMLELKGQNFAAKENDNDDNDNIVPRLWHKR